GNGDLDVPAVPSVLVLSFTVPAAVGDVLLLIAEREQRVRRRIGDEIDGSAPAAAAAVRPAVRYALLAPEREASIAAPSAPNENRDFIDECHGLERGTALPVGAPFNGHRPEGSARTPDCSGRAGLV